MDTTSNSPKKGILSSWLTQPFSSSMDAFQWLMFLGLVIIGAFFWTRVLKHISDAA